jgi:plasmid stability protein
MKSSYVLLPDDLHRAMKVLAARHGTTMAALFVVAVGDLLKKERIGQEIDAAEVRTRPDPVSS